MFTDMSTGLGQIARCVSVAATRPGSLILCGSVGSGKVTIAKDACVQAGCHAIMLEAGRLHDPGDRRSLISYLTNVHQPTFVIIRGVDALTHNALMELFSCNIDGIFFIGTHRAILKSYQTPASCRVIRIPPVSNQTINIVWQSCMQSIDLAHCGSLGYLFHGRDLHCVIGAANRVQRHADKSSQNSTIGPLLELMMKHQQEVNSLPVVNSVQKVANNARVIMARSIQLTEHYDQETQMLERHVKEEKDGCVRESRVTMLKRHRNEKQALYNQYIGHLDRTSTTNQPSLPTTTHHRALRAVRARQLAEYRACKAKTHISMNHMLSMPDLHAITNICTQYVRDIDALTALTVMTEDEEEEEQDEEDDSDSDDNIADEDDEDEAAELEQELERTLRKNKKHG